MPGGETSKGEGDEAAVGYGGLQQASARLTGSPHDDHRGILMAILSREVNVRAFS